MTNSSIFPQHIPDALWVTGVTRSHRLCGRAEYPVAFVDQHGRLSLEIFGIDGVLFLSLLKCLGIVLALETEIPQQDVKYF